MNEAGGKVRSAMQHPGFPYATSVGVLALQLVTWPLLFVIGVSLPTHGLTTPLNVASAIWCLLPLLSIAGIISALLSICRSRFVIASFVGLWLNVVYLAALIWIIVGLYSGQLAV